MIDNPDRQPRFIGLVLLGVGLVLGPNSSAGMTAPTVATAAGSVPASQAASADVVVAATASATDRFVYRQVHMGMQVRLVLHAPSEVAARRVATAAFAEIARLDAMLSNYRPDSEINALADGSEGPRSASFELVTVLARAQKLAELSGGAFDVTAGPLTELWRRAIDHGELPTPAAMAAARSRIGHRRLQVDVAARTVTLAPGTTLDVGGIAKAFILDRALAVIAGEGVEAALVEAGGDLVVAAAPPGSDGWRIDVPHLGCRVELSDAALATSGDAFQFVEIDGVRYSHTVDPRTGFGVRDSGTMSVVANDGLTADGLATTLTLLSYHDGESVLSAFPGARLVAPAVVAGSAATTGTTAAADSPDTTAFGDTTDPAAACLSGPRPARSR